MILKTLNSGRTVQGLPSPLVLDDDAVPTPVADAVEEWRAAVAALEEPARVLREAERAAGEATLLVRGERERWLAEIREKTREEAGALRAAERVSSTAADALVTALKEHAPALRAIGAVEALKEHARAVEAACDLEESRSAFARIAPRVPVPAHVDPVLVARRLSGNLQESPLDALDRVNVPALVEVAGCDPVGFVEVVRLRDGARISTTSRRAAALCAARGGWQEVGA